MYRYIKFKKISILFFFLLTAPFFVCTIVLGKISILTLFISFCFSSILLFVHKKILLDSYIQTIQILYFFPILISLFVSFIALLDYNNIGYNTYYSQHLPSRMVNIFMFWTITTFLYIIIQKQKDYKRIIYIYAMGIFIFFGIIGICQLVAIILNIPFPDLGTRSNLHSISDRSILPNFKRITSIADEPSYIAPFLIDSIIIFVFLHKYVLATILSILLICTLSFGGYINMFLLLCFFLFLQRKRIKFKHICFILSIFIFIFLLIGDYILPFFEVILKRKELSTNFDASDSQRTLIITLVFQYIRESNWLYILFGHGPSSFKYLSATEYLYDGSPFHTTSNNLFVDMAYEGGLFSLACIIFLFIRLYYIFNRIENANNRRIIYVSKILIIHLLLTSTYRADYVSPRFFSILLILGLLYKICRNDIHNYTNLPTR